MSLFSHYSVLHRLNAKHQGGSLFMGQANDPDAILTMKLQFGNRAKYVKKQLLKHIDVATNIKLIGAEFDNETMAAFQQIADVYVVCPHKVVQFEC